MKQMGTIVSILFILSFACSANAQFGKMGGPKFYSDFTPVVGGWSEYEMSSKGEPSSKMKIAVVGKEGDAYWYETVMQPKGQGRMITKMLVSGDPADSKHIKRLIFKNGDEPAMEMPVQMMGQRAASKVQGKPGNVTDKGAESIKVPAGTFSTRHMQYQNGETVDAWIYKDVSPYGLIKSASKEFEMVLVGYGTGAKTLITETPKKFEMPQMPGRPPKGN